MELQTRRQEEKTAKDTQICETRTTREMFFESNKKAPKTTCAKLTHTTGTVPSSCKGQQRDNARRSVVCMATLKDLPSVGSTAGNSAIELQRTTTRQRPQERNEVSKRRLIGPSPLSRRNAGGGASPGGEG